MFKPIPGNNEYLVSLEGKLLNFDGTECTLDVIDNKIWISIHGTPRLLDVCWLGLIAHFEAYFPKPFHSWLWDGNMIFVDRNLRLKPTPSMKQMVFRKPMPLDDGEYRIVPGYHRYAVTKTGVVKEWGIDRILNITDGQSYPCVKVYEPVYGGMSNCLVHRMVALAWVHNPDWVSRSIVNHIDGDKKNVRSTNLEWVDDSENIKHAIRMGLRQDNLPCKVYDVIEKKEYEFPSFREACSFMGVDSSRKRSEIIHRTPNRLINERYQIKELSDDSPWFYEKHELGTKAGRYTLHVTDADGVTKDWPDVRVFQRHYRVWNASQVDKLVAKAMSMYPGMSITYTDNFEVGAIQAYCVATGEILEAHGLRPMAALLGIEYTLVKRCVRAGETRVNNGYAFRRKSDQPWDTAFEAYQCSAVCILATNVVTNEQKKFASARQAAKFLMVSKVTVLKCLKSGNYVRDWKIEKFTE